MEEAETSTPVEADGYRVFIKSDVTGYVMKAYSGRRS